VYKRLGSWHGRKEMGKAPDFGKAP
jgi:hypothetical protein